MSSLKWKEFAKSKTELGNKINYVNDLIKRHNIDQKMSQKSFEKVFEPVTSKLDDVIDSNLDSRMPQRRKRPLKKGEVRDHGIDYMPEVDPYEDMDVEGLIDFGDYVPPQQEKQIVPKPPTYEESLQDLMKGKKELYVDPEYFDQEPEDMPPEYDDDFGHALLDEDQTKEILDDAGIKNYQNVDAILILPEMTPQKTRTYLKKIVNDADFRRNQLRGYKSNVTKKFNRGEISTAEMQERNKRIDNARVTLNEYIKHYKTKLKTIKGYGIRSRGKKQRGGNVMFFNDANQLLKKLELTIGEVLAGNTSIKMGNMGVNILDTLLKIATINRSQYNKIYNNYFKI